MWWWWTQIDARQSTVLRVDCASSSHTIYHYDTKYFRWKIKSAHTHHDAFVFTLLLTFSERQIHTFPISMLMFPCRIFTRMHWRTHTRTSIRDTQFSIARVFWCFMCEYEMCAQTCIRGWRTTVKWKMKKKNQQQQEQRWTAAAAATESVLGKFSHRPQSNSNEREIILISIFHLIFPHFSVCICT